MITKKTNIRHLQLKIFHENYAYQVIGKEKIFYWLRGKIKKKKKNPERSPLNETGRSMINPLRDQTETSCMIGKKLISDRKPQWARYMGKYIIGMDFLYIH